MDSIRDILARLREDRLYEMANVSKSDTGLPYEIWIDSAGRDRKLKHNSPRLKVQVDSRRVPISISEDPKVLISTKKIDDINLVYKWIKKYYDVLIRHWNKEITDREALNLLGK